MGQVFKSVEPTIWALRKKGVRQDDEAVGSLYEHLYGYDPIRVLPVNRVQDGKEHIRKGSAENPELNIINPTTNFIAMQIASDDKS
jgi:hypothetical protein